MNYLTRKKLPKIVRVFLSFTAVVGLLIFTANLYEVDTNNLQPTKKYCGK